MRQEQTAIFRSRELLPPEIPLIVGGRAMPAYRRALDKIGARAAKDLNRFCSLLDELRRLPPAAR